MISTHLFTEIDDKGHSVDINFSMLEGENCIVITFEEKYKGEPMTLSTDDEFDGLPSKGTLYLPIDDIDEFEKCLDIFKS